MLNYIFRLYRKINILSKITYLLLLGTFLALGAITYNIYQPSNIEEKKIDVPVVNKIKEANPLIKDDEKIENIKSEKILNLQTIRVNPEGDVLIAGKTLPNSSLSVISNGKIIAKTLSDNIGEYVIVTENPLSVGDHILAFKIKSSDKKIIISNDAIAIKIDNNKNTVPIVAIIDTDGVKATKIIQSPKLNKKRKKLKLISQNSVNKLSPEISILSLTNDLELNQLEISGYSIKGVKVEARILGGKVFSGSILDNAWNIVLPNSLISGKQVLIVNLINKRGKIIAKDDVNIYGEVLKNAGNKTLLVVQKGDALWKIAYQRLGGGQKYVDIIKLNKDKINNPDLIFPKQLFILP